MGLKARKIRKSWSQRKKILQDASYSKKLLSLDNEPLNIEYVVAVEKHGSYPMKSKLQGLLTNKEFMQWYDLGRSFLRSPNPLGKKYPLYYPHNVSKKMYEKRLKLNREINKALPKRLNANIRKLIALHGMDSSKLSKSDEYTDDVVIEPQPISERFFDTMILKPLEETKHFESEARVKISDLNEAFGSNLTIKFLPYGHWLVNLADLDGKKASKVIEDKKLYFDILNCDYTQDFASCIKSNFYSIYEKRYDLYDKSLAKNLMSLDCDADIGTLYKGSFLHNDRKYNFKVYDKIHSMMNNTGLNAIGLTIPKTLLSPREKWIKEHIHSDDFKSHSVLRVEITVPQNAINLKTVLLNKAIKYAKPLFTDGNVEQWLKSYFLCLRPQIIIDARNMVHADIQKASSWLFENDLESSGMYHGKVFLGYWIEGSKSESSLQGLHFSTVEDAIQKALGNRPITIFTLDDNGSVLDDETKYIGIDKKFKPIPSASNVWTGRGSNQPIPKIIETIFPWHNGKSNFSNRRDKQMRKSSLSPYMTYKTPDDTKRKVNVKLPKSLKGLTFADTQKYSKRKTVHEIAKYGLVNDKPVIVRPDGKAFKTRVKSKIPNPKFYHSHTRSFTMNR